MESMGIWKIMYFLHTTNESLKLLKINNEIRPLEGWLEYLTFVIHTILM